MGLKDLRLTERLRSEPELTVKKAIQVGQATEETKRQAKELATSEIPEMDILLMKSRQKNKPATHSLTNRDEYEHDVE